MSYKHGIAVKHVGPATRPEQDAAVRPPRDVMALLTEGGKPPYADGQAPGVYWNFLREPAKKKAPMLPLQRLRLWEAGGKLITLDQALTTMSNPGFDLKGRRVLMSSPDQLWEFDLDTRSGKPLEVGELALQGQRYLDPAYLADGRILFVLADEQKSTGYVCSREGNRLTQVYSAPLSSRFLLVDGRALVGGLNPIWVLKAGPRAFEPVATIPAQDAFWLHTFDGRVLRYTEQGCEELIGVARACDP